MKALILAAGFGSRLAPITNECPKALVPVNGKPIIFKQIENLMKHNITDITIISGYKADVLEKRIHDVFPYVNMICSVNYETTNNMYSAYLAKNTFYNSEFLLMNADVFFDDTVIESLLNPKYKNAIVTDIGSYSEESMKVIEKDGKIISISKQIQENDALGCSIDVYKFSSEASKEFFDCCADYIENKKIVNKWSEVALCDILDKVNFVACPLVGNWYEIDNMEDLHNAELIFANKE